MRGGIVVAGDDGDGASALTVEGGKEVIILSLGGLRRVGGIEQVPGDDQEVHLLFEDGLQEKSEKAAVFLLAGMFAEHLAQMPIGGVEDAVAGSRLGRDGGWRGFRVRFDSQSEVLYKSRRVEAIKKERSSFLDRLPNLETNL